MKIEPFRFKPFSKKQKKLLTWWMPKSPHHDKNTVIADGSIRAGKTIAMIDGFVNWSLYTFSGKDFIIAGKTIGTLKRNVIRPMLQIMTFKGIPFNYNRSQNIIWAGGNTYYLFDANNESSQDRLQGMTSAGALADEVALFPQNFIEQMIGRCSVEGSKIWMNCNPEGPNHYIKTDYIDKADEKNILRLHFNLNDNLTLSEKIKERYRKMFSGIFYQRYVLGKWVLAEGVVYDMFDKDVHVVRDIPEMKRYWVGVDYGISNPTVYLLIGLSEDNHLFVIDEWSSKSSKDEQSTITDIQLSKKLQQWLKVKPKWIYVDPSSASFINQLWNDRKKKPAFRKVTKANNDVIEGIQKVSSLFSANALYVHNKCTGLIKELNLYSWDSKHENKDKPIKDNDHHCDALRYVVNGLGSSYNFILDNAS